MRVLLAHKFHELTGGAEVFFHETEKALRAAGHDTWMLATGKKQPDTPDNVTLWDAPAYDAPGLLARAASVPPAIYNPRNKARMAALLDQFKPDLLHVFATNVHLSPAIFSAAHDRNIPVVMSCNDYKHICPNYKLFHHQKICTECQGGKFWRAVANKCCKENLPLSVASMTEAYVHNSLKVYDKIAHFTFSSEFMARKTEEFWQGKPFSWSKMRNPFNSAAVNATDTYDGYGLYFGRLIDEKGVDRIVEAADRIDNFPIKIVGNGPDQQRLEKMVAERGLTNIEFLGPRWGAELDVVLENARFVIVPSLWHENFPYVINQSFAAARPVIGAHRGGITELVEHGQRGLIFDPDNIEELAQCIRALAQDADLARSMGQRAKHWSDSVFSPDVFLKEIETAYDTAFQTYRNHRG
ncbi:glycosyltransferase [Roseinatronobacter sp. NSM]|uniref:glycosyltransferase n=1 Tax=Roseinatronobacter sp. NSM TaxID=3457785 RepID=UPI0040360B2E